MTQEQYLKAFKDITDKMYKITKAKGSDYSGKQNPFKSFELSEYLGVADTGRGILVRILDKVSRIANLLNKEPEVADEKITDTLIDLANYAIILKIYLDEKNESN